MAGAVINAHHIGEVQVLQDLIELTNQDIEEFYSELSQQYERHKGERQQAVGKTGAGGSSY
jgi:hypothetical protein